MPKIKDQDLLLVTKAKKDKLDAFAAGVSLEQRTRRGISHLIIKATEDRLVFARLLLQSAQQDTADPTPFFRSAVSRAYYAMYHTLRAVCYYVHGGDDHEEHVTLPSKIPSDFPDRSKWENDLKRARYERNRADYDPYPRSDRRFKSAANEMISNAGALLIISRKYLRIKGCRL